MADPVEIAEARAERLAPGEREMFEAFKRLGMSAPAALAATAGRDGRLSSTDSAEGLVESFAADFRQRGHDAATARRMAETAAAGRSRTLREVREALDAPAAEQTDPPEIRAAFERLGERRKPTTLEESAPPARLAESAPMQRRLRELVTKGMSISEALEQLEREEVLDGR